MKNTILIFLVITLASCTEEKNSKGDLASQARLEVERYESDPEIEAFKPDLITELISNNNIILEEKDDNDSGLNPYDYDNKIYMDQLRLKYKYTIQENGKQQYLYRSKGACVVEDLFTDGTEPGYEIIESLNFIVDKGLRIPIGKDPKKLQPVTHVWFKYGIGDTLSNQRQTTAIVENKHNVWMHDYWYNHLEFVRIAANPYIRAPFKVGNKWKFEKNIRINNLYPKFNISHNGPYQVRCEYQIVDYKPVMTNFGKLDCYIINSIAYTGDLSTKMIAYFNEEKGFVELKYDYGDIKFHLSLN